MKNQKRKPETVSRSTFHSGYITIYVATFHESNGNAIYIPLWLYYNFISDRTVQRICYLHSTLVILQLKSV